MRKRGFLINTGARRRLQYVLLGLLTLSFSFTYAKSNDQTTITLNMQDASLEKVFKEIEKQTHYSFLYMQGVLKNAKHVDIKVTNGTIEQVLEECFTGQEGLVWRMMDKVIVIKNDTSKLGTDFIDNLINISGKVLDEFDKSLVGANVKIAGSTIGTITDSDGSFTLYNINANSIIEISYVGFESVRINIAGRQTLVIHLSHKQSVLDETVVVAYGTTTKRLATGNIATVRAKDIIKQPVSNPLLALQGRVPGLVITQNTGLPGGGITVRLQGANSIFMGNDPLIIIDGVPYPSQMLPTTTGGRGAGSESTILGTSGGTNAEGGNPLNYINPADVERIDILKDADATAIYGSRAANGAILITTKSGKSGKMKVELNLQYGIGTVPRFAKMLNTDEYLTMRKEAINNDGIPIPIKDSYAVSDFDLTIWDSTRYTDWQKELIGGTAQSRNINIGVSGGTNNIQYRIGCTNNRATTVFRVNRPTNNSSVNFNISSTSNDDRFRVQLGSTYYFSKISLPLNDVTSYALTLAPNAPALYTDNGTINWQPNALGSSTWSNPLALQQSLYENETSNLISNANFSFRIAPGLEVKSSFGYNQMQTSEFYGYLLAGFPPEAIPFVPPERNAAYTNSRMFSWIIEPQISFQKDFRIGTLDVLVGSSVQKKRSNGERIIGTGYSSDQVIKDFGSATRLAVNTLASEYKYLAAFGRISYNWANKYLINLTMRRDGSSRFGPENRFHNFGAAGVGWVFSQEKFISKNIPVISFGKIKGSLGSTGNDQIGDYSYLDLYSSFSSNYLPYQGLMGISGGIFNPYLQWEETKKIQGGIELGFFNNRLLFSTVYARNRTSNQILLYELPIMTGVNAINSNFPATVQNTSWEFTVSTVNFKKKAWSWETSANLTIPRNKLVSFTNLASSTLANQLIIGYPLGAYRTYSYAGVNPSSGLYQVYDNLGAPTSEPTYPADLTSIVKIGSFYFYGGLENKFQFGNLSLDFLFQFARQIGGTFIFSDPGRFNGGLGNQPHIVLKRWQKLGDISEIQRFSTASLPTSPGDHFVEDMWYCKIRNLSLSYNLPENINRRTKLNASSIYLRCQNIATFSNYEGLDPETLSRVNLPALRMLTIGLSATF